VEKEKLERGKDEKKRRRGRRIGSKSGGGAAVRAQINSRIRRLFS
jgi:hypothetical protein